MSLNPHHRHYNPKAKNAFLIALVITCSFAVVEAVTGWFAGSLTLLGDAGHMVSDSIVLSMAAFAMWIASKPPSKSHTYGLGRAEVLAAWFSSVLMLVVIISLSIGAIERFHKPTHIAGLPVIIVAALGLIINMIVAWVLSRGEKTLNTRAAIMHVISDLLGSVAALISGTVIYFTGWTMIDPILSIFICLLILFSALCLLRESLLVLMEGVPKNISVETIQKALLSNKQVLDITDLHVWTLTSGVIILTAHVKIDDLKNWSNICKELAKKLENKFGIKHITLQPEPK